MLIHLQVFMKRRIFKGGKTTSTAAVFWYTLNGNIDFVVEYDIASYEDETGTLPNLDSKASGLTFGGVFPQQ